MSIAAEFKPDKSIFTIHLMKITTFSVHCHCLTGLLNFIYRNEKFYIYKQESKWKNYSISF